MKRPLITFLFSFLFLFPAAIFSQTRELMICHTETPPKIDGVLDEDMWKVPCQVTDFVEFAPNPGASDNEQYTSCVWIFYDQTAIYVAAELIDLSESIYQEFTKRDDPGNSDFFSIFLDTYCDRINGYEFSVTSAGQQIDKRHSPSSSSSYRSGDESWDAVWESAVKLEKNRWFVEMKIPYSAIRFSKDDRQVWGINIERYRRKTRQELFWNERDPKLSNFVSQWGTVRGIDNVKAPTLLSFSPYVSGFVENIQGEAVPWSKGFSAGMDLKWGISRAFTLDATLIPDFGQVASDPIVHNLTPFEVVYNEKRPFFMEGTELFSKGDYFYSRRIGAQPMKYNDAYAEVKDNEIVTANPSETKMINAVKFSGRTNGGLGVGFLNAVTSRMFATIEDTISGKSRRYMTAPLSDYNVLVLDQSLKNNSYISLVNTSVVREGAEYDSDVLGVLFRFNDKNNKYFVEGSGTGSFFTDRNSGYKYSVKLGKGRGNWQYDFEHELMDDKIEIGDMGVQKERNRISFEGDVKYSVFQPSSWYNRFSIGLEAELHYRFDSFDYEKIIIGLESSLMFKDYSHLMMNINYAPQTNDYYEPKQQGRFLRMPTKYGIDASVSSNYAKPFFYDAGLEYMHVDWYNSNMYKIMLKPAWRASKRFTLSLTGTLEQYKDDIGYTVQNYMSRRDRSIVETMISSRFAFNANMNITLDARHYVSKVKNKEFFFLQEDGLLQHTDKELGRGVIYNLFYLDLVYTWRFAPGSELNLVWKNQISPDMIPYYERSYFADIDDIFTYYQKNSVSLKLIYYFDWNYLKRT